jgi:hypothetical protein
VQCTAEKLNSCRFVDSFSARLFTYLLVHADQRYMTNVPHNLAGKTNDHLACPLSSYENLLHKKLGRSSLRISCVFQTWCWSGLAASHYFANGNYSTEWMTADMHFIWGGAIHLTQKWSKWNCLLTFWMFVVITTCSLCVRVEIKQGVPNYCDHYWSVMLSHLTMSSNRSWFTCRSCVAVTGRNIVAK